MEENLTRVANEDHVLSITAIGTSGLPCMLIHCQFVEGEGCKSLRGANLNNT